MVALIEVDPQLRTHLTTLISGVQTKADAMQASIFGMLPDGTDVTAPEAVHQEEGSRHAKAYLYWAHGGVTSYYVLTVSHCKNGRFVANFYPGSPADTWLDGFNAVLETVGAFNEAKNTSPRHGGDHE